MALDPEFAAPPTASEEVRKNTVKLYIVVKRLSTHRWTVAESFAERRLAENFIECQQACDSTPRWEFGVVSGEVEEPKPVITDPRHDALDGHCADGCPCLVEAEDEPANELVRTDGPLGMGA